MEAILAGILRSPEYLPKIAARYVDPARTTLSFSVSWLILLRLTRVEIELTIRGLSSATAELAERAKSPPWLIGVPYAMELSH